MNNEIPEIPEEVSEGYECQLCEDGNVNVITGECDTCAEADWVYYDEPMQSDISEMII